MQDVTMPQQLIHDCHAIVVNEATMLSKAVFEALGRTLKDHAMEITQVLNRRLAVKLAMQNYCGHVVSVANRVSESIAFYCVLNVK